jgi:hypothetical protein
LDGTLADGGTIAGSITYDPAQVVNANVHGWANQTFQIVGYDVTIHPAWSILLGTVQYSDTVGGDTAEVCAGVCTFGGQPVATSLRLTDGGLNTLQMSWDTNGGLLPSTVKVMVADQTVPGLQGMELIRAGRLQPVAVPEPSFWLMLAAGLLVVIGISRVYGEDLYRG